MTLSVPRRFLFWGVGSLLPALAGCGYQARRPGAPGSTANESSEGSGGATVAPDQTDDFVAALESQGLVVDSTMRFGPSLSLGYLHRPEHARQDRVRLATTYAEYRQVSKPVLSVTVIAPGGETREGVFRIEHPWARAYAAGDLSRSQYLARIDDTYSKK